jgi:hypothetical protein
MIPPRLARRNRATDLRFWVGAGDGNRTRIISLGIGSIDAVMLGDLRCRLGSDREAPSRPGANCTLTGKSLSSGERAAAPGGA